MTSFRISSFVSNTCLNAMFDGEERRFFVAAAGDQSGYLYPDGTIKSGCYINKNCHGWYKNEADAKAAVDTHNKKETPMRRHITTVAVNELVDDALLELTNEDVMFTAYDVTQKLRSENPALNIVHESVRDHVTHAYYNGDLRKVYERELRDLPGQNVQAFVYAPTGSDFSRYGVATPPPAASVTAGKVIINATFSQVFTN